MPISLLGDCPAFDDITKPGHICDGDALLSQLVSCIEHNIDESVGAILLQCSDLPPFAAELQEYFGLPVFDMTGLINWLHAGVVRRRFGGYL